MRFIFLIVALLAGTVAEAETKTPRGIVFAYECKQIVPKRSGFSCSFSQDGLHIQWHEKPDEMPSARREFALYEYNRITLRYLELGGKDFDVGYDYWKKGQWRSCHHMRGKPYFNYTCTDIDDNK